MLVAVFAAPRIQKHEESIVNTLECTHKNAYQLVVVLGDFCLFKHVPRDCRVMGVRHYLHSKQDFNKRISESNANCVNEDVTRVFDHSLVASHLVS